MTVREAERGLKPFAFGADGWLEWNRPRAVLVRAGGFRDEGVDRLDGEARGDLARHVTAHPVGHHEEAEIGAGAVAVLVAAASKTGVRADGPGQLHWQMPNVKCRMAKWRGIRLGAAACAAGRRDRQTGCATPPEGARPI